MFAPKTVDSVMKVFTKALDDLSQVSAELAAKAAGHEADALQSQANALAARQEASRAASVAEKLRAIVS